MAYQSALGGIRIVLRACVRECELVPDLEIPLRIFAAAKRRGRPGTGEITCAGAGVLR